MTDIYLTSTFTNSWNVSFNPKIGEALENARFSCYLPHRDTNQKGSPFEIFSSDLEGIKNTKCILGIAINESPNWGAELGYAYNLQKPIIALKAKDHNIPLICNEMITETFSVNNLDEIENYIQNLIEVLRKYL